jgi:site-specific DNA-methyltransferase (adenine-specific)
MPDLFTDGPQVIPTVDGDIVQADALDLLQSLDAGSVSCIVTDPPYGIAYHSNYYKEKNPHAPISQDWDFQIGSYLDAASRVLRNGGAIYIFTRFDVLPLWTKEVPSSLAFKNAIIWKKDNWSSGDLTGNFGFQYEIMMFLVKGRHTIRGKRWSNVWEFPRVPAKKLRMPAEKPIGLFERAIMASSDHGDLIVDTFGGSGTAAEAAMIAGRRFLVGDVDKKMVAIARKRIGLPGLCDKPSSIRPRLCPIFAVEPPDPCLWGMHPEDMARWRGISED